MRIILGLILVIVGFVVVWKTRTFLEFFGMSLWAETKLGGGGTSLLYKSIGIIVSFIGFIVMMNLGNAFLEATLGSLFQSKQR
ncbi:MAG: hypothetical protein AAB879_02625 [Patescibacteria group bacterium]